MFLQTAAIRPCNFVLHAISFSSKSDFWKRKSNNSLVNFFKPTAIAHYNGDAQGDPYTITKWSHFSGESELIYLNTWYPLEISKSQGGRVKTLNCLVNLKKEKVKEKVLRKFEGAFTRAFFIAI